MGGRVQYLNIKQKKTIYLLLGDANMQALRLPTTSDTAANSPELSIVPVIANNDAEDDCSGTDADDDHEIRVLQQYID